MSVDDNIRTARNSVSDNTNVGGDNHSQGEPGSGNERFLKSSLQRFLKED